MTAAIKTGLGFFFGVLVGVICMMIALYPMSISSPESTPTHSTVFPSARFIQLCSGLEISGEQTKLLATANCLGRIRGYVDSHQQTVHMLQQRYTIPDAAQLWCIPRSVTDKELLTDILTWVDSNPTDYTSITTRYNGTTAAMGIFAATFRSTYPCTK